MLLDVGSFLDPMVGCWERDTNLMVLFLCELGDKDDFWAFGLGNCITGCIIYQDREYTLLFQVSNKAH